MPDEMPWEPPSGFVAREDRRSLSRRAKAAVALGVGAAAIGQLTYVAIFFGSSVPAYPGIVLGLPAAGAGLRLALRADRTRMERVAGFLALGLGMAGMIVFAVSLTLV